jgi:hypothetical protein
VPSIVLAFAAAKRSRAISRVGLLVLSGIE